MESHLFVYGTLMVGVESRMAGMLQRNSKWLGSAYISGLLYDLGRYPGAQWIPDHPHRVYGQVFLLDEPEFLLQYLDEYEGIDPDAPTSGEYVRKLVPAKIEDLDIVVDSWFYHCNLPPTELSLIESGRYLDYFPHRPKHLDFIQKG